MAITIGESSGTIAQIGFTLGEPVINTNGLIELETTLQASPQENVVIVGAEVSIETATAISEKYRTIRPGLGVLLLRRRVDTHVLTQALRAGIREVVPADDARALLEAVLRSRALSAKLSESSDAQVRRGKIILVFAAKGGCGKTTVSTNLAVALAEHSQQSVCLVDFDLEFGDVAVALRLEPTKTISDAVPIQSSLDMQALSTIVISRNKHLDVLLAPRLPADSDNISADLAEKVLNLLSSHYSYVVVDSPPAFSDVILKAFDMADEYILITTLDMPAVKNLQVTLDTLDALGYDKSKAHIIVNRATANSGLSVEDLQKMLDTKIEARLPATDEVSASVNRGRTLVEERPRGGFAKHVEEIIALIEPQEGLGDLPRRRLFGRKS